MRLKIERDSVLNMDVIQFGNESRRFVVTLTDMYGGYFVNIEDTMDKIKFEFNI